jgi:hypothetical protein
MATEMEMEPTEMDIGRAASELGRTGHFFTNPETWPGSPASPWRADKGNACTPFSI